jgi:aromatic-L-amino-acid/L-tryptophan decarboxylase
VDRFPELADLAARENLWFHVDAAYGGFFLLTERGRARLAGIERADSVTLDPHKSLFLPYGVGALVVRDPRTLATSDASGRYLQDTDDLGSYAGLPDYGRLGPELTREARGLRVWLPLHLHGVAAFRDALDEKLDLAEEAHRVLRSMPGLEVPWHPELTIVGFRVRPHDSSPEARHRADEASRRMLEEINASTRAFLSSTEIDDRFTIRLTILSHRTHADRVTEALEIIAAAAAAVGGR